MGYPERFYPMKKYRRIIVNLLIGLVIGTIMMIANQHINSIKTMELALYDKRFELRGAREPSSDIILVTIDENSIQDIAAWPWPRSTHGKLVDRLKSYGAKVIAFDVMFEKPSLVPEEDKKFADAMRRAGNVIIGSRFVGGEYSEIGGGQVNTEKLTLVEPLPELGKVAAGTGYYNPMFDLDSHIRSSNVLSVYPDDQGKDVSYDSLELAILRKYKPDLAQTLATQMSEQPLYYINFAGIPKTYKTYTYSLVLNNISLEQGVSYNDIFKDKIVLIGATAQILHDNFDTPFASTKGEHQMPGVEIHAAALDTLLNGIAMEPVSPMTNNLVIVLAGLVIGLVLTRIKPVIGGVTTLVIMALYSGANWWLFAHQRIWLNLAAPLLVMGVVFVVCSIYQFLTEERKTRLIKSTFSGYVSPKLVDQLTRDPDNPPIMESQRKFVTLLFSDVQGFTSISEKLPAEQVVNILNEYLEQMASVVFANDGVLDKYIGDGLMAWWGGIVVPGIPEDTARDAWHAVKTAIEMQMKMEVLQKKWLSEGIVPLVIRIGVNSGEAIIGNIGSSQKMDYTAIGDTVNLASRLEGQNKEFNTHMMISESTYQLVKDRVKVRFLAVTKVKGKEEGVRVYELIGFADQPAAKTAAPAMEVK